jgi:hypothetical protein
MLEKLGANMTLNALFSVITVQNLSIVTSIHPHGNFETCAEYMDLKLQLPALPHAIPSFLSPSLAFLATWVPVWIVMYRVSIQSTQGQHFVPGWVSNGY